MKAILLSSFNHCYITAQRNKTRCGPRRIFFQKMFDRFSQMLVRSCIALYTFIVFALIIAQNNNMRTICKVKNAASRWRATPVKTLQRLDTNLTLLLSRSLQQSSWEPIDYWRGTPKYSHQIRPQLYLWPNGDDVDWRATWFDVQESTYNIVR